MLAVPHLRQQTDWTCGPACVAMLLGYYGRNQGEMALADRLGADPENGVDPQPIVSYFRSEGYRTKTRFGMSLEDVSQCLAKGWPVMVAYQDWAHRPSATNYHTCWDNGHYAIIAALEPDRLWLVDPSSDRPRRSLKTDDFIGRWRDLTKNGAQYRHWGLGVGPRKGGRRGS